MELGKTIMAEPEGQLIYDVPESHRAFAKAIKIPIENRWWLFIKGGVKTVEVKKNSDTWKNVVEGSIVNFIDETTHDSLLRLVKSVKVYKNIEDLLLAEGLDKVLPGIATIAGGIYLYEGLWPTLEDRDVITAHGLKAIRLTKL